MREYGLRMVVVSRALERIGDHAVDIGEQIAYLLTAEFREFTDASHPSDRKPDKLPRSTEGAPWHGSRCSRRSGSSSCSSNARPATR